MIGSMKLMQDAVRQCIECEEARRKNLKDGAPASTYTDARIAKLKEALAASEAEEAKAPNVFINAYGRHWLPASEDAPT